MHQDQDPRFNLRNGKIGLLPAQVREELNTRIIDGQRSEQLLPWLNGLPQVRSVLAEHFEGKPIIRQNLSAWVCGGYQDWLRAREQAATARKLAEYTLERARTNGRSLTVVAAELAAKMLVELLGQMSRAFGDAEQMVAGQSALGALIDAFGPPADEGGARTALSASAQAGQNLKSEISNFKSDSAAAAGTQEPERRLQPAARLDASRGPLPASAFAGLRPDREAGVPREARQAKPAAQSAEPESYTLAERVALLSRAVAGLTQLRKREQADEAMELKRERLKQTGQMVELQRERLKLQARMHEDRLNQQKIKSRSPLDRPTGGGIGDETLGDINMKLHGSRTFVSARTTSPERGPACGAASTSASGKHAAGSNAAAGAKPEAP